MAETPGSSGRVSSPGHDFITLDRTNLLRLLDVVEANSVALLPEPFRAGGQCVVDALREIAVDMPHLYGDQGYTVVKP